MFDTNKYKDLWKYLRGESRPVVLYGGGNGADKVLDRCLELGLEVRYIRIRRLYAESGRQAAAVPLYDRSLARRA